MNRSITDIFDLIESTAGTTAKCYLMRDFLPIHRSLMIEALDPSRVFYYTLDEQSLPEPASPDAAMDDLDAAASFMKVLQLLASRSAVGNQADDLVNAMFARYTEPQQKWFARILNKDLRIGVKAKLFLKEFRGAFAEFETQLCEAYEPGQDVDGWTAEIKYDGFRAIARVDRTSVTFFSRSGKPLYNTENIHNSLIKMCQDYHNRADLVLWIDGELRSNNFADTISKTKSKNVRHRDLELVYYVFDFIENPIWAPHKTKRLEERREDLKKFVSAIPGSSDGFGTVAPGPLAPKVLMTESKTLTNGDEVVVLFREALARGHEGLVLKRHGSYYTWKRSKDWVKVKAQNTVDLKIKSYYEGEGKRAGMLGGFMCDYNGVDVAVGGGYTDDEIVLFWTTRDAMIGTIIEVEYQEETPDGSLRHPRFVRCRPDKDAP